METVVRFYPLTAGEFYLGMDERGLPSVFGRDMDMTVRNIVNKFGTLQLAQAYPNALDKFDPMEAIEQFGRMNGIPVKVLTSNEELKAKQDARAQQEQAQQAMMAGQMMAEGAKNLGSVDMEKDNLLGRIAGATNG